MRRGENCVKKEEEGKTVLRSHIYLLSAIPCISLLFDIFGDVLSLIREENYIESLRGGREGEE